jgi:hypothetical protein
MNFIDDLNINGLFERYTESYTKVKSNLYGLYAIQPRIKGRSYCYEKLRLWRRWLLKKSRTNTVLVGAPFTAGFTSEYRYDNQVNPYYHAGIPFFCNAFQGAQLLSPNNLVGGSPSGTSAGSPYTFSYAYYSNGRPRVQTTAVYGASGPVTQTTAYFYQ